MDGPSESSFGAPAVSPRSPPGSLGFYGKRTQMVKVQALKREIGLLQEELKLVEGLQPASTYCKEVDDFVGAKPDPLVTINQEIHKSHPCWKRLWIHLKTPSFFACCKSCKSECLHCSCLENTTCVKCYNCEGHSCPTCCCCCFEQFFHKCKTLSSCCGCRKACYSCCCQ